MATRNSRPQLQPPDLSPPARQPSIMPSRVDADDPRFDAAAQLETHDAYVRGVQEGRVRVVNPDTLPHRADEKDEAPPRRRSPETSLSTKVPTAVMQQLRRRYAETGVTIRNQILIALRKDGLQVNEDDIQDERKRPRR
ncbi:MAG: hypothetical protein JO189_23225 [Deltaproteobacteria bacterium]|nr:hypothetical protein [Deltaproteobacteria bacterium]